MNAFAFVPAIRRNTHVLIALAGASGSGKTYSGLELATGLAGERGRIAVIDTEAGRALHYADLFKFDHCELTPPFTPDRYREAIAAAEQAGYAVIVIDSMSHEHDGEGGLIEMAEQEAQKRKDGNSAAAWAMPKAKHKRMMNRLLQLRTHLIFCLRADDKIKMAKVFDEHKGREVTTIEPAGWQPICEKRFMFEMTASFVLTPENPGVPGVILKLQKQHRPAFPKGQPIGPESGRVIAEWATGGAAPERREADEFASLNRRAITAARSGKATFRGFWQELDADERSHLRPMLSEFEAMAIQAEADEDPFARQQPDYEQDPGENRQDRPAAGAPQLYQARGATALADTGQSEHPGGASLPPPADERKSQEAAGAGMATRHPAAPTNGDRPRDAPKVAQYAPRDETFWSKNKFPLPGEKPNEIQKPKQLLYYLDQYLRQCLDQFDVNAIEADNAARIEKLPPADRREAEQRIADRRKEIGGAQA